MPKLFWCSVLVDPNGGSARPGEQLALDLAARYPYSHWGSRLVAELGLGDLEDYTPDEKILNRVLERFSSDNPKPTRVASSVDYLNPTSEVIAYLVAMGFLVYSSLPEYAKIRFGSRLFNWFATRTAELVKDEPPEITSELLSVDFSLPNRVEEDGTITVGLADFLRLHKAWQDRLKLVDLPIHRGTLILDRRSAALVASQLCFSRLSQILEEKLRVVGREVKRRPAWVAALEAEASKLVPKSWADWGGEGILPRVREEFPPCMRAILEDMARGSEPPHFARFSFAAFMRMIGAPKEETLRAFSTTADYNESIASYHVSHIYGEIGSHTAYTAPSCDTLKAARLCPVEGYCNPKAKHPAAVYRINLRRKGIVKEEERKQG